ncbi:MAG: PEP/pyruvate-binding domain-containing protein [Nanoarchaeota archaeon]
MLVNGGPRHMIVLVAAIARMLPVGDVFGTGADDEFVLGLNGRQMGVFKRFEYLSVPFTIAGMEPMFVELLDCAGANGSSFAHELRNNPVASGLVDHIVDRMARAPAFTRQTLDMVLGQVYVKDGILAQDAGAQTFEAQLAKVVVNWKRMADFYCVEALVGGQGRWNPLIRDIRSSGVAGSLDGLDSMLPGLRRNLERDEWLQVCLRLSSVIGRDYRQIDNAVDVLDDVLSSPAMSADEAVRSIQMTKELSSARFTTNAEMAKFYNSLIRFHNWLPSDLKAAHAGGDCYDSVCAPSKAAIGLLDDASDVADALSSIRDATSPKGVALATLVDENIIGDRDELALCVRREDELAEVRLARMMPLFNTFSLDDHVLYSGLTGGKWKGLKLLHDARSALNLCYKVPDGFVVSSTAVSSELRRIGALDLVNQDIFSMDRFRLRRIRMSLEHADFASLVDPALLSGLGDHVIVRSSMYGEDGDSNFSGTYDSVSCLRSEVNQAMRSVAASYFSDEAVASRVDLGLAHVPGIAMVVQRRIAGEGGVLHVGDAGCALTIGQTPQEAVDGLGEHRSGHSLYDVVRGTPLEPFGDDLKRVYDVFGDSDIEFVLDSEAGLYLTQLRRMQRAPPLMVRDVDAPKMVIDDVSELRDLALHQRCIVSMAFLGAGNVMEYQDDIMGFVRRNREYIAAVEGDMPVAAHIPNKIEGHFRIPYLMRGGGDD